NKKIEKEIIKVNVPVEEIRSIEAVGSEVFLHECKKNEKGETEIRGYGEYGILPKLKSNNERVLARLYDRVLEGRERKGKERRR
ncbi:hypothetical protein, partial [Candidatus Endomicrobiellum devescovinae]|uniref:hypothetical protein n=1 Tax=Candidatus Endomicrobiellum devescovinae TaxID=3242322 RepID=UPI0028392CF3|nr:hypothetical protein [Endomicrobium sp.]